MKFLLGTRHRSARLNNFSADVSTGFNQNEIDLKNASGHLDYLIGGEPFFNSFIGWLTPIYVRPGADLGFVYEFRPEQSSGSNGVAGFHIPNPVKYKFRFGASVLDLGALRFPVRKTRTGNYDIDIPDGEIYTMKPYRFQRFRRVSDELDRRPEHFTRTMLDSSSYSPTLPRRVVLDADYRVAGNFYLNVTGVMNIAPDRMYTIDASVPSSLMITPRYESELIDAWVPIQFNKMSGFNAGLGVRVSIVYFSMNALWGRLADDFNRHAFSAGLLINEPFGKGKPKKLKAAKN